MTDEMNPSPEPEIRAAGEVNAAAAPWHTQDQVRDLVAELQALADDLGWDADLTKTGIEFTLRARGPMPVTNSLPATELEADGRDALIAREEILFDIADEVIKANQRARAKAQSAPVQDLYAQFPYYGARYSRFNGMDISERSG